MVREDLKTHGQFSDIAKYWYTSLKANRTIEALRKHGFKVELARTQKEALARALEIIPLDATVGIAGSVTIRQIGLPDALIERGNTVIHHWKAESGVDVTAIMREELTCDTFVSSSNAITEDGKLINIDGAGNRIAGMIFGPKKVLIVAGVNKIVRDVEEGIRRVKTLVAPMNARRLGKKTPCARTGICTECASSDRICRITMIIERKPTNTEISVILVHEELGF